MADDHADKGKGGGKGGKAPKKKPVQTAKASNNVAAPRRDVFGGGSAEKFLSVI